MTKLKLRFMIIVLKFIFSRIITDENKPERDKILSDIDKLKEDLEFKLKELKDFG